ncbi:uncharacterized protein LOC112271925 [Brachypodium distachyon]|nr:uncharacterized protein LOC112271925 [Brachypodium distachyon]|eukprot:XP_024317950.1 uncharacterized protein LOC112271925 [Brachypodium distachyon]
MNGSTYSGMFRYAVTKLYSFASNLHTLVLFSYGEAINSTPGSAHKFLQLRHLKIYFDGRKFHSSFDFLSMVSFLEACPVLETFFLSAGSRFRGRQEPTLKDTDADSWHIKRIPGFRHDKLKKVSITGVQSTKSLIELACQILESCSSLRCLVLDTTSGYDDRSMCENLGWEDVMEALKGFKAIKRHLKGKVPSSVELTVLKPCDRCHMSTL